MDRILLGNVKGKQGDEGKSAYEIAVGNGFSGTEAEWLESLRGRQGDDGFSAYDVAVRNGFSGTEEEWLGTLKGAPGVPGPAGSYDILGSSDAVRENTESGKIVDALVVKEVFQSVSDGKAMLASAITGKGVQTDASETFEGMAENIKAITSGSGGSNKGISLCMYEIRAVKANQRCSVKEKKDITILPVEG